MKARAELKARVGFANQLKISGEQADSTAIVVTDAKTQEIHAIFKSNVIQYKETFRFVYTLIMKHIPNSVIIVENNIGDTVIEYFINSPLKHLVYYEFQNNKIKEKRKKGIVQPKSKNTLIYGIATTTANRPKYFDILFDYVHNNRDLICAREIVEEIECLEYKTSTRIEAALIPMGHLGSDSQEKISHKLLENPKVSLPLPEGAKAETSERMI